MRVRIAAVIVATFVLASALSVTPASARGANDVFAGVAEGKVQYLNKQQLIVVLNDGTLLSATGSEQIDQLAEGATVRIQFVSGGRGKVIERIDILGR